MTFNLDTLKSIKHLYDPVDWTQWLTFKLDIPDLFVNDYGIRWTHLTPQENWGLFLDSLPSSDVRFSLCNFEITSPEGLSRNKTIFILWAPQDATVKDRMKIAIHCANVKTQIKAIGGVHLTIQANELDDISYNTVCSRIKS